MRTTARRVAKALVLPVLIASTLVGCGGDDEGASPSPTSATTGATTTAPATTASSAPATSAASTPGSSVSSTLPGKSQCPPIAARAPQPTDATIPIDFDGSGTAETLRVYQQGADWHVRGEFGGYAFDDQVVPGSGPMAPVGAARLNPSDANQEAWVKVANGAYTEILTIFVFRDCRLQRATLDGEPAAFPVGASVRNAVGIGCFMFDQGIEVFSTTSDDGVLYSGESQLYTLDVTAQPAPTLEPVAGWPMPVSPRTAGGPLGQLSCGDLGPP
jgi:hypothetical protein